MQGAIGFVLIACPSLPKSLTWHVDRLAQLCPSSKPLMNSCDCCLSGWLITRNCKLSNMKFNPKSINMYKHVEGRISLISQKFKHISAPEQFNSYDFLHCLTVSCSCNMQCCLYPLQHFLLVSHQHQSHFIYRT